MTTKNISTQLELSQHKMALSSMIVNNNGANLFTSLQDSFTYLTLSDTQLKRLRTYALHGEAQKLQAYFNYLHEHGDPQWRECVLYLKKLLDDDMIDQIYALLCEVESIG